MTEKQFRESDDDRKELQVVMANPTLRTALSIIINKRRILERGLEIANISGDPLQSLRLFNQRIGMEDLILQLHELTTPEPVMAQDLPSTYGNEEAYRQLQEIDSKIE